MNSTHGNTHHINHANPQSRHKPGQVPVKDDLHALQDDVEHDAENDAATRSTQSQQEKLAAFEGETLVDPGKRQANTDVEGVGDGDDDQNSDIRYPPPYDDVL